MVSHLFFYQLMFLGLLWALRQLHSGLANEMTGEPEKSQEHQLVEKEV